MFHAGVPRRLDTLARDGRRADGAVLLFGLFVLVPYLLAGPGFFVDDWFALRNAVVGEWWEAAGPDQWRARPGAAVVYAVVFGLIGARPGIHAAIAVVVVVATAVVLRRLLGHVLPPLVALAVSLTWLLVPNHTSLEVWPSAINIGVSLLLAVVGAERLVRNPIPRRTQAGSGVAFAASILCYEATAPALVALVALVAWNVRADRRTAVRLVVLHGFAMGAALAWMLTNWHPSKTGLDAWLDPVQVVNGHVSTGLVGEHAGAVVLGGVVVVTSIVAAYLGITRPSADGTRWPQHLIIGGWATIVVGAAPFARYFYSPVGLGDRVTVVSGIGGAMVLVGVLSWIGVRQAAFATLLGVLLVVGAAGHRASLMIDYATAADDSRRILTTIESRWPEPPEGTIVFGPYPIVKRNIVAFIDADWPVQWLYADGSVSAGFTLTTDAFASVPSDRRVDLLELSDLEPTDRLTAG